MASSLSAVSTLPLACCSVQPLRSNWSSSQARAACGAMGSASCSGTSNSSRSEKRISTHCRIAGSSVSSGEDRSASAPPGLHRLAQEFEHLHRVVPAQAGVGDAAAVFECDGIVLAGGELLRAGLQVALDHHAEDAAGACGDLRADVASDVDLALVLLVAVR